MNTILDVHDAEYLYRKNLPNPGTTVNDLLSLCLSKVKDSAEAGHKHCVVDMTGGEYSAFKRVISELELRGFDVLDFFPNKVILISGWVK